MAYCEFPKGFVWGTATAAYQVEGATSEEGRGSSVWDTFCRRPGAVEYEQTGDVACDSYHLYQADIALMKELGVNAYRFSVSWSRIFPDGTGKPNPQGLDYYQRLVDALLKASIKPWMTLFHWDLPQALEDRLGGWESRETAHAFADYAAHMVRQLGDRLKGVFTFNEFFCFLDKAYGADAEPFAPGKKVSRKVLSQARHNALLAHGLALQAMRAVRPAGGPLLGLADNPNSCVPVLETPQDIAAAREAFRARATYLTPIMEGAYHPYYLQREGADGPEFTDAEMKTIATPMDFVGMNIYSPTYIRHAPDSPEGWEAIPCGEAYPKMHMWWHNIGPSVLYWAPRFAAELWKPSGIYITESGCPYPDRPNEKGEIWDLGRMMYLQQYLAAAHRAVAEGYPLRGYFLWSLIDNFEWTSGYTKRCGIHYVNYQTQQRTPKHSARFYQEVIRRNALG